MEAKAVTAPQNIIDLVQRFSDQRSYYLSGKYNETELRRDFLDPFFEALGWDVRNLNNASEKYRDVIHEMSVEVEGQAKSADYLFKIGESPVFFVEAKKPSIKIETDPGPAFQIRRYAWSKKLPVSLLTNFDSLAIYDCKSRPVAGAAASLGRIDLYRFTDYLTKWEEISAKLSRRAVTSGAYDQYVQGLKGRHGTTDVDDSFLEEMERWRDELAHNIALRNPSITQRELNSAVQSTIDRIIFLRICEDRGIEPEEGLKNATDGIDVYGDILELFRKADKKYNSGLFHFNAEKGRTGYPDTLTPTLKIDDKVFKDILANLYLPKSPYAFKYFSADILGQVYERFLGKVITLSEAHHAKVEEKPEVRKAGGVYYTPTYIVNYIVKNTVGELLKDHTPESFPTTPLRVLDPACGSGSFLLGAYQYLMDWYLEWYTANDPAKWTRGSNPALVETLSGWQLTMEKKKEILLDHIYGVDIDSQAVEVTKLSLLLKVVENPGQLSFLTERILPDLGDNIKCGNSLIGPDYYEGQQGRLFDSEEQYRVNAFDWQSSFPQVFKNGGFNAVIGNPPYDVMEKERGESSWPHSALLEYVNKIVEYKHGLGGKLNLYRFFIVRSHYLIAKNGRFGMIVPLSLMADVSCSKTRLFLFSISSGFSSDCFPQKDNVLRRVFRDAKLSTCIVTYQNAPEKLEQSVIRIRVYPWNQFDDEFREAKIKFSELCLLDPVNLPVPLVSQSQWDVCRNVYHQKGVVRLGEINDFSVTRGEINQTIFRKYITSVPQHEMLLKGVEVGRYFHRTTLSQGHKEWFDEKKYFKEYSPRRIVNQSRIATQRITGVDEKLRIVATLINPPYYFADSTNSIVCDSQSPYSILFLLGILNSKFMQWRFKLTSTNNNVGTNELLSLPFKKIDFNNSNDLLWHNQMVGMVNSMLDLHKQLAAARLPDEKERLQRQINTTDRQIDNLVYQLYGLTDDEIRIVEGE